MKRIAHHLAEPFHDSDKTFFCHRSYQQAHPCDRHGSEKIKDYDRDAIRNIPELAAVIGMAVYDL